MVAVRVYVEGGGESNAQRRELREGFAKLFARALGTGRPPKVECCGGRAAGYADFKRALKSHPEDFCILLVDSEEPVRAGATPWEHVRTRGGDGWARPPGVLDEQLHFMAQAMEAWLVADPEALEAYYGPRFKRQRLPRQANKEEVSKGDLYAALDGATKDAKTKGKYSKSHGFALIAKIDPAKVRAACPQADRFFDVLRARTSA